MNKTEAAQNLGVSVRTLENYIAKGLLKRQYVPSDKSRPTVEFDKEEVRELKERLALSAALARGEKPLSETDFTSGKEVAETDFAEATELAETDAKGVAETSRALARLGAGFPQGDAKSVSATVFAMDAETVRSLVMGAANAIGNERLRPSEKLLLSLPEAAIYTGLAERLLRGAIKSGELPARKIGRALRVRPQDLKHWIDTQF